MSAHTDDLAHANSREESRCELLDMMNLMSIYRRTLLLCLGARLLPPFLAGAAFSAWSKNGKNSLNSATLRPIDSSNCRSDSSITSISNRAELPSGMRLGFLTRPSRSKKPFPGRRSWPAMFSPVHNRTLRCLRCRGSRASIAGKSALPMKLRMAVEVATSIPCIFANIFANTSMVCFPPPFAHGQTGRRGA
jgi:hypothetical protein